MSAAPYPAGQVGGEVGAGLGDALHKGARGAPRRAFVHGPPPYVNLEGERSK